ncbi:MAG: Ig-like domain-containing protein [Candidatus Anstonellaceae archaeon]
MNCKILFLIILFNIFIFPIFAEWYEEVEVRVLDKMGRPVPNAAVYIVWEISRAKGNGTTTMKFTNERGRAYFKLYNTEFNENLTNYDYVVFVSYQGKNYSEKFRANVGSMPRTVMIDAYLVKFIAKTKDRNPLSIKLLIDSTYELYTDNSGVAEFILTSGDHVVRPIFFDLDQEKKFSVNKDMVLDLDVELYSCNFRVIDDNGVPIPNVKVSVGPFSYRTDKEGLVRFENLTKSKIVAEISYQKYLFSETFDLSKTNSINYVLDTHPPKIEDISTKLEGNLIQLRAVIVDPGKYPSSFKGSKAKINVRYYPAPDVERVLPMYSVGYNTYEAILKLDSNTKNIKYSIEATDSAGNTLISSDVFVLEGSSTNEEIAKEEEGPIRGLFDFSKFDFSSLLSFIVVLIVMVVAFYLYKNKFSSTPQPSASDVSSEIKIGKDIKPSDIFKSIPKKKEPQ